MHIHIYTYIKQVMRQLATNEIVYERIVFADLFVMHWL